MYAAVAEAIDEEFRKLAVLGREPEAVWPRWRAMMAYGATVEVPAFLVPREMRPRLEAGRPMLVARVSADDEISFRVETIAEATERLGL
ncbi:hypothetical protein BST30_23670 [Mycobacterium mantenii]|uniref:Uncharacterized protein n=1 Tax=Mycobacterium mantenii TaxID=560555 RepID=A0A1X0FE64_MYCNT|nr:hypothetical protein BST30_23670 [Mycobacterium mantenii]